MGFILERRRKAHGRPESAKAGRFHSGNEHAKRPFKAATWPPAAVQLQLANARLAGSLAQLATAAYACPSACQPRRNTGR
jgi:hypothetical protein